MNLMLRTALVGALSLPGAAFAQETINLTVASSHPTVIPWVGMIKTHFMARTDEILAEAGIPIVDQSRRGRGAAIREGVFAAKSDQIVLFSPDGNEDPNDVPVLFQHLSEGYDMVIASRFLPNSVNEEDDALLPFRKWANIILGRALNMAWGRETAFVWSGRWGVAFGIQTPCRVL